MLDSSELDPISLPNFYNSRPFLGSFPVAFQ